MYNPGIIKNTFQEFLMYFIIIFRYKRHNGRFCKIMEENTINLCV